VGPKKVLVVDDELVLEVELVIEVDVSFLNSETCVLITAILDTRPVCEPLLYCIHKYPLNDLPIGPAADVQRNVSPT
jgi:hypothetical protein